jgi:hypothetical protein
MHACIYRCPTLLPTQSQVTLLMPLKPSSLKPRGSLLTTSGRTDFLCIFFLRCELQALKSGVDNVCSDVCVYMSNISLLFYTHHVSHHVHLYAWKACIIHACIQYKYIHHAFRHEHTYIRACIRLTCMLTHTREAEHNQPCAHIKLHQITL